MLLSGRKTILAVMVLFSLGAQARQFEELMSKSAAGKKLLGLNARPLVDFYREQYESGNLRPIQGREEQIDRMMDILVATKGHNPILLGEAGVGKTDIVRGLAQRLALGQVPKGKVYSAEIANAEILQIDLASLSSLSKRPEDAGIILLDLLTIVQKETGKFLIPFFDEIHSADQDMWQVLKPALDTPIAENGLRCIGATTEREYQLHIANDNALSRRFEPVGVSEFSVEQTVAVIKSGWQKYFENRYGVIFDEGAIDLATRVYKKVRPEIARPDGPIKFLEGVAIQSHRAGKANVGYSDVYEFMQRMTRLPADPQNLDAINQFIAEKKEQVKSVVKNQDETVDLLFSALRDVLFSPDGKPEMATILGPSGTGKSYLARVFADVVFGDGHFFSINGSAYKDSGTSFSGLLGARPGTNGFKDNVGALVEFMSNPGKGKYGGLLFIDEIEKMHPDKLMELGMELFDEGVITEGRGRKIRCSNLMIVAASNRGIHLIFPEGFERWTEEEVNRRLRSYSQRNLKAFFTQAVGADDKYQIPKELANRMGRFGVTRPHNLESALDIAKSQMDTQKKQFQERNQINIDFSPDVVRYIAEQTYNKQDGVRDLSRAVRTFFSEVTALTTAKHIQVELVKVGSAKRNWYFSLSADGAKPIELVDHSFRGADVGLSEEELADLEKINQNINAEIFGQKELVDKTASSIQSWMLFPTERPLFVMAVGPTGAGKTETPKVIARVMFKSDEKVAIIPMGDIRRSADLTRIFGASPQYVKSDQMGLLEKALIKLGGRGILVLDEILNANDPGEMANLLMPFYNIVDQGKWVSPNSGREYNFSGIVVWANGNLLQDGYIGLTGDDMRREIYNETKKPENVRRGLVEAGVPPAFIGRADVVVHTKPIFDEDKLPIGKKMLGQALDEIKMKYPDLDIKMPDSLVQTIASSFFSSDLGGRSLRHAFESQIKSQVASALLLARVTETNAGQRSIEIAINDKRSKKHYNIENLKEEFDVTVSVYDKSNSTLLRSVTKNILDEQQRPKRPDPKEYLKVVAHENGHALLNDPSITGQKLRYITVVPGSNGVHKFLGYAGYTEIRSRNSGINEMKANLVRIAGGRVAQEVMGFTPDVGWTSDYGKLVNLIAKHYVTGGLMNELWGAKFDRKTGELIGTERQKNKFAELVNQEISEALDTARRHLTEQMPFFRFMNAQLIRKGSLTGEQYEVLKAYFLNQTLTTDQNEILANQFGIKAGQRPAQKSCAALLGGEEKNKVIGLGEG